METVPSLATGDQTGPNGAGTRQTAREAGVKEKDTGSRLRTFVVIAKPAR